MIQHYLNARAKRLLKQIASTDDKSVKLLKRDVKQASALIAEELATTIPISTGGSHLCLTQKGIDLAEELK